MNNLEQCLMNTLWINCSVPDWTIYVIEKYTKSTCPQRCGIRWKIIQDGTSSSATLSPITNLSTSYTTWCSVTLSRTWSNGATSYRILRNWVQNTTVTWTSVTITESSNWSNTYWIQAINSTWSSSIINTNISIVWCWWTTWCVAPANPTWFMWNVMWANVNLIWNFVSWATAYKLYKWSTLIQSFTQSNPSSYSYVETTSWTYSYRITALTWTCESLWSTTTITVNVCVIPANVTWVTVANNSWWPYVNWDVVLWWNTVMWALQYKIYEWTTLIKTVVHPTSTTVISAPSIWWHTYIIRSENMWCESTWTNVSFTVQNCNLSAPTSFTIWDAYWLVYQCWNPILSWSAVAWANSYDIFQASTFVSNVTWTTYTVMWNPVWASVTYNVVARASTWCVSPQSSVTIQTSECAAWQFYMWSSFGWERMFNPDWTTNSMSWLWMWNATWEPLDSNITYLMGNWQVKIINRWLYTQRWLPIAALFIASAWLDKPAMIWNRIYVARNEFSAASEVFSVDLLNWSTASVKSYWASVWVMWTEKASDWNLFVVLIDTVSQQIRIDKIDVSSWATISSSPITPSTWWITLYGISVAWWKVFVSLRTQVGGGVFTNQIHVLNETWLWSAWTISWWNWDKQSLVFNGWIYVWGTNNLQYIDAASQIATTTPSVWSTITNIWQLSTDWTYIYWHWTTSNGEWRVVRFTPSGASTTWVITTNYTWVWAVNWPSTLYI